MDKGKCCGCMCHKVPGVILIVVGLLFLLSNLGVFTMPAWGIIWPALIILLGVKKLAGGLCKCCKGDCATTDTPKTM